jgi:pyrimidine-specific ribonucleoside hydrolase
MAPLAACGGTIAHTPTATPVIVDTDMASDDIMALSYLLKVPGISVQAVTVEGTGEAHGPAGARNVLRLMRSLGIRRSIPVGYGPPDPISGFRSFPAAWRGAADGMYNLKLPAWRGAQPSESAVRLLADTIARSTHPVELITLGPLTNVALALQADPGLTRKIARIYSMAGAVRVAGNEPIHQQAEWNVYIDAAAASRVLKSGVPVTFIPLDASDSVPITPFIQDAIAGHLRTPALRIVGGLLADPYYTQSAVYFWDPLAVVTATEPAVARLTHERLAIDTSEGPGHGRTSVSPAGSPALTATSANAGAFERQFLATLNGGHAITIPPVPASRRLPVTFDGTTCTYLGPRTAPAGLLQVPLVNRSQVPFDSLEVVIGRLAAGRTLADVQKVIRQGTATSVPGWFQVTSTLPAAPGAEPTWGVSLTAGRYALVCVQQRTGALSALAELAIR